MPNSSLAIGVLLLVLAIGGVVWHTYENKKLGNHWHEHFNSTIAKSLVRFSWSRSIQLFIVFALLLAIGLFYEWQLLQARIMNAEAAKQVNELKTLNAQFAASQPALEENNKQLREALETSYAQQTATYKQLAANPPNAAGNTAPKVAPTPAEALAAVYGEENDKGDAQAALNNMKKRYEDALVLHLFMKKCKKANGADYEIIMAALSDEIAAAKTPAHLQEDIVTAAQGSFNEIYANSSCKENGVNALFTQYDLLIEALSQRFSGQ